MKIKYILLEGNTPIVFPEWLGHDEMAHRVGGNVVSAGFCHTGAKDELGNTGLFHCYGESIPNVAWIKEHAKAAIAKAEGEQA